jgi:hypothetical protein
MPFYRIYLLSLQNRIVGLIEGEHADDHAAVDQARRSLGEHAGVEVWQGARLVGREFAAAPGRALSAGSAG